MLRDCKKRCGASQIRNRFTYMTTGIKRKDERKWERENEKQSALWHTALAIKLFFNRLKSNAVHSESQKFSYKL